MANTEQKPQPKTTPMRWLKLGVAKDPEFDKKYYLYDPKVENNFFCGYLVSKSATKTGIEYKFELEGYAESGDTVSSVTATHYAICKAPIE